MWFLFPERVDRNGMRVGWDGRKGGHFLCGTHRLCRVRATGPLVSLLKSAQCVDRSICGCVWSILRCIMYVVLLKLCMVLSMVYIVYCMVHSRMDHSRMNGP